MNTFIQITENFAIPEQDYETFREHKINKEILMEYLGEDEYDDVISTLLDVLNSEDECKRMRASILEFSNKISEIVYLKSTKK